MPYGSPISMLSLKWVVNFEAFRSIYWWLYQSFREVREARNEEDLMYFNMFEFYRRHLRVGGVRKCQYGELWCPCSKRPTIWLVFSFSKPFCTTRLDRWFVCFYLWKALKSGVYYEHPFNWNKCVRMSCGLGKGRKKEYSEKEIQGIEAFTFLIISFENLSK